MTLCKRAHVDPERIGETTYAARPTAAAPSAPAPAWPATFVAEVIADPDDARPGRLCCRFRTGGVEGTHWFPTTRGVLAQRDDRVLCVRAEGAHEPIVTAVVDGLRGTAPRAAASSPRLRLQADEALLVAAADGTPLVEVRAGERKVVVTVLEHDTEVALAGALSLSAARVAIAAREGDLTLTASGDAKVTAEIIHLN